jgi:catechol 2,3-dioxygenase-like lactoylglutathione lyase family enzyme
LTGASQEPGWKPVLHLAEIVLWSRDLDESLAFYRDLFGLEVMPAPELPVRFLRAGPGEGPVPEMIVLVPHPEPEAGFPGGKTERPLHHIALSVAAASYDELERRCRDAGLDVRSGTHPVLRGVRTFYVDDPDGNEVEVIAPEA